MYYGDCIANFFVSESEDELYFAFYVQKSIPAYNIGYN